MITLKIDNYCENCPEFEAKVEKDQVDIFSLTLNKTLVCDTVISCVHRGRCKAVTDFLRSRDRERKKNSEVS